MPRQASAVVRDAKPDGAPARAQWNGSRGVRGETNR